jgi:hypothetical protein
MAHKLADYFNSMSAIYRHLLVAGSMLGAIWVGAVWVFSPHIDAYAQTEVLKILKKEGITPEGFGEIQKKVDKIAQDQTEFGLDVNQVKDDIAELKKQSAEQNSELDLIKQQSTTNGVLLNQLVDGLINRRSP